MQASELLDRHRAQMIRIARNASPDLQGNTDVDKFLDAVRMDAEKVRDFPPGRDSLPGEDAFWWCFMQLEDLVEITNPGPRTDPYVKLMLGQLKRVGTRLARNKPLPDELAIGWFDETVSLEDESNRG